jgi:enoyl-CoA hydratase/carnithine racemase
MSDLARRVARESQDTVRVHVEGRVSEIVLDRPEKMNAINSAMLAGIRAALDGLAAQPGVRVVILRGEGRCFSAGGDLDEVRDLVADPPRFSAFLDYWHASLAVLEQCPLPIIAAVHGLAFAGGFELMQACDLAVVGERTRIGDQHANFGLFPAGGSTQRLSRLVGPRVANWMLMTGEAVTARDAVAFGLANRLVAKDEVLAEARRMAEALASKSRGGTAAIKRAVQQGRDRPLADAIGLERPLALSHMASQDVQVGLAAFAARATPQF